MSVEYVKLTSRDINLLVEILQNVVDYKYHSLAKHNWEVFESKYLKQVIDYIQANEFKVVSRHDNIFVWIIDQIVHSRKVVKGLKKQDWIPLVDFELTQECLRMLRAASRGQVSYNLYCQGTKFNDLFL